MTDGMRDLERDAVRPTDEDTPMTRHIRMLENRLDKALIKYNEAQSIRKTYEQIVKRLREERIGFDNQLGAIERTLKAKEHDLEELVLMSHDANHAKEMSKAELIRVEMELAAERIQREKELAERRHQVRVKQEINARMERQENARRENMALQRGDLNEVQENKLKQKMVVTDLSTENNKRKAEEEKEKITSYEEAFKKIKEATRVNDINEVIQKFMTQEDTTISLKAMTKTAQERIETLNDDKASLKAKAEEAKYSSAAGTGSRRIVDEYEGHLSAANSVCDQSKQKYEKIAKVLVSVKAGTQHLVDMLDLVKMEGPTIPVSDDTIIDVLNQNELKLQRALDLITDEEDFDETTANVDAGTAANIRVRDDKLQDFIDYDENAVDDDDDDNGAMFMDRGTVKNAAYKMTGREARKKARRDSRAASIASMQQMPTPGKGKSKGSRAAFA